MQEVHSYVQELCSIMQEARRNIQEVHSVICKKSSVSLQGHRKKWWFFFNFSNIFDLLTSRTEKIVW